MAFGLSASAVGLIGAGAGLVGSAMASGAAGDAADAQVAAADRASATQEAARKQQREDLMPWMKAGQEGNNKLQYLLGNGGTDVAGRTYGELLKGFDQNDLNNDVVYNTGLKFGLDTGTNAINTRAASSGGYGSGAALKALTRFGNDYGTTKAAGAYDRLMNDKNQRYNFLAGQSQMGQNAAAGVGAAGMSAANGIAQNQLAAGNAQSAGMVGSANAISGGISDATNAYRWNQLLNKGKPAYQTPGYNPTDSYLYGNAGSGS